MTIVNHSDDLIKYISKLNLEFSTSQTNHLLNLITGLINLEGKKNLSNLNRNFLNTTNRSNLSRFLTTSPWDEETVNSKRLQFSCNKLIESAQNSNEPIFLSIDDTMISKKKESKHIEGMTKLFSHVSRKNEWAHCQVALQGKSGDLSIPLDFKVYLSKGYCEEQKTEFKSKNDLAYDLIKELDFVKENLTYLLMDSWYSSSKLIMSALALGIYSIVPLKSNRKFFPEGIEIQLKEYEKLIDKSSLNLVTVKGKDYYTYRYEGNLKGIENAVVVFSYELNGNELKNPMYILSTDICLSNREIISYYLNRWDIEVSFRYQKDSLGLCHYEMRSLKGIKRYWYIIYLAYNYLTLKNGETSKSIGTKIQEEKMQSKISEINIILELKAKGYSRAEIIELFIKNTKKVAQINRLA